MIPYATPEELGRIIHDERKQKGYTQTKLARYSGAGITFISNLENSKEISELGVRSR
ncbi:helix-turn-helix domain-containing protein [Raoultibacter phocaeensis]|uniref:helix-turn-helix domain-containing protein n=1 Tax=Raoultibacter phocaeensis TaxID=2479841 RepID=UPI001C582D91|nr:helix-turn-helix domain-containing protein [Raoultibacter phocaeensis]